MKRILPLMAVGLYGCSTMVQTTLTEDKVAQPPKKVDYITIENPIEEYKVKGLIVRDDLNHNIPFKGKISIEVRKGEPLSSVTERIGGFPVVAEGFTGDLTSPSFVKLEGKIEEVLEELSALYGVYWTYDNGTVRFVYEKTLIYTIPLIARDKLFFSYGDNMGRNIREDLFDEIEKKLTDLLNVKLTGKYIYSKESKFKSEGDKGRENVFSSEKGVSREEKNKEARSSEGTKVASSTFGFKKEKSETNTSERKENIEDKKKVNKENGNELPTTKRRAPNINTPIQVFKDVVSEEKKEERNRKNSSFSNDGWVKNNEKVKTREEKDSKLASKEVSIKNKDALTKKETESLTTRDKVVRGNERTYTLVQEIEKPKSKVVVIRDAGIIAVRVTRKEEPLVRNLMKSLIENRLSTMVVIKAVVVETSEEVLREFRLGIEAQKTSRIDTKDLTFGLNINQEVAGLTFGLVGSTETINALLGFAIINGKGRILSSPQVMTLSGMPAKIKSAIDYPYLEPQTTSLQTGTAQLTYEIKSVTDGIEMSITPYAIGDSVILTFGLSADKYLGDKTTQAGQLGTVELPIKAPRDVLTTLRVKAGQGILIAGVKSALLEKRGGENSLVPADSRYYKRMEGRELLIIIVPKIVRFIEEE